LEGPRLSAKERVDLDEARRRLGQRLVDKTKDRDEEEKQDEARKLPSGNSARPLPNSSEDDRARQRARLAMDLLQLAGVTGAGDLDKALNEKMEWQPLGDKLREVWAKHLPEQFERLNPASRSIKLPELLQADR